MKIKYHGHDCFELEHEGVKVIMDPLQVDTGLNLPELDAQIVTISQKSNSSNDIPSIKGNPRVFHWPGEYEMSGIHFRLIRSYSDEKSENIITISIFKGFKICHLGGQSRKLTPEELEQIGDVDVLLVPVGGNGVFDAKKAKECIEQIEPRIVIPMSYHIEGSTLNMSPLNDFLSEMGSMNLDSLNELKLKRSDLPEEHSKVIVLSN